MCFIKQACGVGFKGSKVRFAELAFAALEFWVQGLGGFRISDDRAGQNDGLGVL